jgi:hypothetical protein
MRSSTMSRKRRQDDRIERQPDVRTEEAVIIAKPRGFEPRHCSACTSLREDKTKNYSFVYHTRGKVRYCKCGYCGNTWSQFSD